MARLVARSAASRQLCQLYTVCSIQENTQATLFQRHVSKFTIPSFVLRWHHSIFNINVNTSRHTGCVLGNTVHSSARTFHEHDNNSGPNTEGIENNSEMKQILQDITNDFHDDVDSENKHNYDDQDVKHSTVISNSDPKADILIDTVESDSESSSDSDSGSESSSDSGSDSDSDSTSDSDTDDSSSEQSISRSNITFEKTNISSMNSFLDKIHEIPSLDDNPVHPQTAQLLKQQEEWKKLFSSEQTDEFEDFVDKPDDMVHEDMIERKPLPISLGRGVTGVFDVGELVEVLEDENGANICVIDVPASLHYVDHMVIVTGKSTRHLKAMSQFIVWLFKQKRERNDPKSCAIEGLNSKDWFAMDLGNIALHMFLEKTRERYNLETLWTVGAELDAANESESDKEDPFAAYLSEEFLKFDNPTAAQSHDTNPADENRRVPRTYTNYNEIHFEDTEHDFKKS